jgi:hypothetical protein
VILKKVNIKSNSKLCGFFISIILLALQINFMLLNFFVIANFCQRHTKALSQILLFILPQHKIIVIFYVVLFEFIGSVPLVYSPSFWTQSQNKRNFTAFLASHGNSVVALYKQ